MRFLLLLLLAPLSGLAGEYAVLSTGFRLHVDRHEVRGSLVLLHRAGGVTEMPADRIAAFEAEDFAEAPRSVPAPPSAASPEELVERAAARNGLPEEFVRSVAEAESGYRTGAVSSKGAIGIMQLTPATARTLGVDANDPEQNAEGGARYLRQLLLKYKDDPYQLRLALAAYNAGPAAVDRYRGIPPYEETQRYVERVLQKYLKSPR